MRYPLSDLYRPALARPGFSGAILALYPTRHLAVSAFVFSVAEVALMIAHEQRLWGYIGFPWHARVSMAAVVFLTTAVVTWVLYWAIRTFATLKLNRAAAIALSCALGAAAVIGFFAYAASWTLMWKTGQFADWDTIVFGVRNFAMLYGYAAQTEPLVGLTLGVAGAVAGLTATAVAYRSIAPVAPAPLVPLPWRMADGGLVVLLWGSAVSLVSLAYGDPPGPALQTREWWKDQRPGRSLAIAYRVNPIITAAAGRMILPAESSNAELSPTELGPLRASPPQPVSKPSEPRLSLVLIEIESLRHDALFLKHDGIEIMPVLNRLAVTGLNFTGAYAASTHSNYADPALLSSLYPLRKAYHHYYSPADPWPKALVYDVAKKHGCAAAIVSSQNETWGGMDAFLKSPNLDLLFDSRSSDAPKFIAASDITFARYATETGMAGKLDDHVTISRAIQWIDECSRENKPYTLCVNLQTSHFPYQLPQGAKAPFQPCEMDFPASFVKYPIDKVPVVKNAYYNALRYIDEQIGALVSFLDERGLREKTLIVVMGDNGECFYENGYSTHAGPPFEPAIHVPLVMNCPGTLAPREEDYLTQAIDVVPTALALMGAAPIALFSGNQRSGD